MHPGAEPEPPFRVRGDGRLRAELAYCVPKGIPHSAFLAWPVDDQDKALAWLAEQSLYCPRCHTREDEWDPKQGGDRTAYVAEPHRCPGCETLAQAQREMSRFAEDDDMLGVSLHLIPRPDEDEEEQP